ncbi:MAG: alpha/beta hydrolase [Candidatus Ornithospirochaeta sp.]
MAMIAHMKESKRLRASSTLQDMRQRQRDNARPLPMDAEKSVIEIKGVEVERITLPSSRPDSALIYIHGGGFKNGFASNGYWVSTRIARELGMTVYGINYSLAPEHTYPAAFMDCVKVWKNLVFSSVDPGKSAFLGTSAGGTLALSSGLWCRDHGIPLPSSMVLSSPYMGEGMEPTEYQKENDVILSYNPEEKNEYFSSADSDDPYAYPVLGEYYGFPFVTLFASEKEILKSHSDRLDEILSRDGIPHSYSIDKELWHAFLNADVPENEKYVAEAIKNIKENFRH